MTDKQRAFLTAYLDDPKRNATRAAAAAGFKWPGKQGPRLKQYPEIAEAIRQADLAWRREWARRLNAASTAWRASLAQKRDGRRRRRRPIRVGTHVGTLPRITHKTGEIPPSGM